MIALAAGRLIKLGILVQLDLVIRGGLSRQNRIKKLLGYRS